jgi:hypothetical protein
MGWTMAGAAVTWGGGTVRAGETRVTASGVATDGRAWFVTETLDASTGVTRVLGYPRAGAAPTYAAEASARVDVERACHAAYLAVR